MVLFVVILLRVITISAAQQNEVNGPENTVSIAGSQVTLTCAFSSDSCSNVDWLKSNPGVNPITIYKGTNATGAGKGEILNVDRNRYSVFNSSGCHLVMKNVQLSDAGRFTCRVYESIKTVEKDAYLVVLKAEQKCETNSSLDEIVEGDQVQLTCEVTYSGTDKASMLWEGVENAPAAFENGNTISRSYSVVASAPEIPPFTCVTLFEDTAFTMETLRNIRTTCKTPAVRIFYPVTDVNLSPSLPSYSPGTIITCTAAGHPSPGFGWQERVKESNGTWMDILNQTSNQFAVSDVTSREYRCFARNVVRGRNYRASSHTFSITSEDSNSRVVFVAVGISVGILVLIVVCVYVLRRTGSVCRPRAVEKARMPCEETGYVEELQPKRTQVYTSLTVMQPPKSESGTNISELAE